MKLEKIELKKLFDHLVLNGETRKLEFLGSAKIKVLYGSNVDVLIAFLYFDTAVPFVISGLAELPKR